MAYVLIIKYDKTSLYPTIWLWNILCSAAVYILYSLLCCCIYYILRFTWLGTQQQQQHRRKRRAKRPCLWLPLLMLLLLRNDNVVINSLTVSSLFSSIAFLNTKNQSLQRWVNQILSMQPKKVISLPYNHLSTKSMSTAEIAKAVQRCGLLLLMDIWMW